MGHERCYLVAALEYNHNGNLAIARRMVDVAVDCGFDAIKVPKKDPPSCYSDEILHQACPDYPELGETWGDVCEALELKPEELKELREYCRGRIAFVGAPYDICSVKQLDELDVDTYQIDPPLLPHLPLLEAVAARRKPIFAALGMCNDREAAALVEALAGCGLTILHCVAGLPLPVELTALSLIGSLRERFGRPVGYLSMEEGISVAPVAYALGATVIEKAFTLDKHFRGPGHAHSIDREELRTLATLIRCLERSLVFPVKRSLLPREVEAFSMERASLLAAQDLAAGVILKPDMLVIKASPRGLSPGLLPWLTGRRLLYDIPEGKPITFGMVEP